MTERKTLKLATILSKETQRKLLLAKTGKQIELDNIKKKKQKITLAVQWLCQRYPKCFNIKKRLPIKYHIEKDIFSQLTDQDPSRMAIRQAIKWYVQGTLYLKNLQNDLARIDLEGANITDQQLSQKDKDYSTEMLEKRAIKQATLAKLKPDNLYKIK